VRDQGEVLTFRDAVLSAYGGRCAISHLPEPRLLDAAHIVMDADEQLGQPIVSNGLPVSKGFCVTTSLAQREVQHAFLGLR
jgi:putative restriction endonuclease